MPNVRRNFRRAVLAIALAPPAPRGVHYKQVVRKQTCRDYSSTLYGFSSSAARPIFRVAVAVPGTGYPLLA